MKRNIQSKLILCIILASCALNGIIFNEFSRKYLGNNHNLKNDVIFEKNSQLKTSPYLPNDWSKVIIKSVGVAPKSVYIGDANNDGFNDIVTANSEEYEWADDDVSIFLWNETKCDWNEELRKRVGNYPNTVVIADANNDGYNDIVTANYGDHDISILIWNENSKNWDTHLRRSVPYNPECVIVGDANNDGYNDLIVSHWWQAGAVVSIRLWNDTSNNWNNYFTLSVGLTGLGLSLGDANNDGYNDIVTANTDNDDVSILLWNITSNYWNSQIKKPIGDSPQEVYIGDVNNDGYNDIASANTNGHSIGLLIWNSTVGDWNPCIFKSAGSAPRCIFTGDANNDGYNDLVTANSGSDDISIHLWNSTIGNWNPELRRTAGDGAWSVFIEDANNDGYNDITIANIYSDDITIRLWILPYIEILTPKNTFYSKPKDGYYPATYSFDYDPVGTVPIEWENYTFGDTKVEVEPEFNGHKNIVKAYFDESGMAWNLINHFNKSEGTIEFWIASSTNSTTSETMIQTQNGTYPAWIIGFRGGNIRISIPLGGGSSYFFNIGTYQINMWYHIRIDFRSNSGDSYIGLNQNEYKIYINGEDKGTYEFLWPQDPDRVHLIGSGSGNEFYSYFDAFGYSWDPAYELGDNINEGMKLSFVNNTNLDWIGYSLDQQDNKTILGNRTIPLPSDGLHSIQIFGRNQKTGEIIESEIRNFTIDTIYPEIIIYSPIEDEVFSCITPKYHISITEVNLDSIWYTIDNGLTNFSIDTLKGNIDQHAWLDAPLGPITLKFYGKDLANNTRYEEIIISKVKLLNIDIVDQSFTLSEFSIKFYIYNESIEAINFASIQIWWDGTDISSDVQNLGNGLYLVSLEPINVAPGEDPILLNMTISASGYEDKYFETYIAVEPPEIVKYLLLENVEHSYSLEYFNFTFFVCDELGQGIASATFRLCWDGSDVSSDVQNLGNGYYFVSLEPITIAPGEDPILLNMTISASGYEDKYYETYVAIDPDTLQKGPKKPSEEFPLLLVVTISVASVGVIAGVAGIYWFRKRSRKEI